MFDFSSERFCTHLDSRCFYRIKGTDAQRYLNGQVTNDVNQSTLDKSIYALVTNAKGKLQGELFIHRLSEEEFLLDAPSELQESLLNRLDQYLIADDALLEDVTEEWTISHCFFEPDPQLEAIQRKSNRFGINGWDVLSQQYPLKIEAQIIEPDRLEHVRISNLIPKWGKDLYEGILPQEAQLEDRAISYNKGCYVGQEVISRIKSIGRVNKTLTLLATKECLPKLGELTISDLENEIDYGSITSASAIQENDLTHFLVYLHRKADHIDNFSLKDSNGTELGRAIRLEK